MNARHCLTPCFLVLAAAVFTGAAGAQSSATTQAALAPTTAPATAPVPAAMPAEQILDRMLQTKPGLSQPLLPAEQPPDKPFLRKEGELIRQRIGRLVRAPQGQFSTFAFESDGTALEDPPMSLLPGAELTKMEDALKKASRDLRFRVTGTVTLYGDKNYLLIERAEIAPDLGHP